MSKGLSLELRPDTKITIGDDIEIFLMPNYESGERGFKMMRNTKVCIVAPKDMVIMRKPKERNS
jgi:sRNA-binding carbon storage regulator CsrA